MIDRVMLHQIIDALPEERLQNVERVLQYEAISPSESGRIRDEIAARIREQLAKRPIQTDDWDSLRTKIRQGIERGKERTSTEGPVSSSADNTRWGQYGMSGYRQRRSPSSPYLPLLHHEAEFVVPASV